MYFFRETFAYTGLIIINFFVLGQMICSGKGLGKIRISELTFTLFCKNMKLNAIVYNNTPNNQLFSCFHFNQLLFSTKA